ncbi:hypothetical protein CR513_01708, partial [Mucuna pruriens]
MGRNLKTWEAWLPHIEFAYNRVVNEITSHAPFELVYGYNALSPLDIAHLLVPSKVNLEGLSKAKSMVRLHKRPMIFMEKKGKRYAKRKNRDREGIVYHRREMFPSLRKSKLLLRGTRPFPVLKHINDNAYVSYIPHEFGGSMDNLNLRIISFQEEKSNKNWRD